MSFFVTEILPEGKGAWGIEVDEDGRPTAQGRTMIQGRVHSLGWLDGADDPPPLPPLPAPDPDRPLYAYDWTKLLAISNAIRSPVLLTDINIKRDVERMLRAFSVPTSQMHSPSSIQGGRVLDCKPGIWPWSCTLVDVKAMYPSVMAELGEKPDANPRERAIGMMMLQLKRERERLPELKVLMNSVYGLIAAPCSAYYDPELANKITARGREILGLLEASVERAGGCVLFGHTDSVCFTMPPRTAPPSFDTQSRHIQLTTTEFDGVVVFNKTTHWLWKCDEDADAQVTFKGPMSHESEAAKRAAWGYLREGIEGGGVGVRMREEIDAIKDAAAPVFWGAAHGLIEGFDSSFATRSRGLLDAI